LPLPPRNKTPPPTGYTGHDAGSPSYPDIETWKQENPRGNTSLRLDGEVGIDVDAYNGKKGGQTLAEAEKRWGKLPPTYRSTSHDDGGVRYSLLPGTRGHQATRRDHVPRGRAHPRSWTPT
jgi:hypothetical protein